MLRPAPVNLALQGGGAHGAFTWGVLDALLEDGRFSIEAVSGASAGAMNALCLAEGLRQDGREGARAQLRDFWHAVARSAPLLQMPLPEGATAPALPAPLKVWMRLADYFVPGQLNPFDINPLREILAAQVDFEALRRACPIKLFIAATHAGSGRLRLWREHSLSLEAVLASACLPTLHHTVVLDGAPYWDGGYAGNPPVWPLCLDCRARDIILILLQPRMYVAALDTPEAIKARTQEFAFTAAFQAEMRQVAEIQRRSPPAWWRWLGAHPISQSRFHLVSDEAIFANLPQESKLVPHLGFLEGLCAAGRQSAQTWLRAHAGAVGRRSSLDVPAYFG